MKIILSIFLLAGTITACTSKKDTSETTNTTIDKYDFSKDTAVYSDEMKRYWLVLLKKGLNRTQDSASAKIQSAHLANIERLAKEGKIIMAGPMGAEGDLRGIFIMDCKDSTEVEQMVKTDTAVITGRLIMEYYPWWSNKGKYIFK